ncbi:hypothetical protein [Sandaracinus amylolyticus]|uniref:Uncharacterized protein n=1 Tax=Sandaracinus amylolyticus TaxID=927083 RepID=A0A0F6W3W7_9BACT|nr:hypothetical protein [Sandaracinus amylolyticus]AKF06742.1 hypothetical protein DB32_003891 [Sandaracinus amylolyticus]
MKLPVDRVFRDERVRYVLKLHCEDCALWDDTRDACAHGYPTDEHRAPRDAESDQRVVFCKDFEVA